MPEDYIFDTEVMIPEEENKICPAVGYQKVGVCVPVTVTPFAHAKEIKMKCCGKPVVSTCSCPCTGKKNGICTFTISQTICVEVPIEFGANVQVGDTYVDCLGTRLEDCHKGIDEMED